ncbi:MAG: restriction endonuclease subunit S, partial [Sandaracinaceae bacterium]|nr:restriction endonuclease subunit S [Sandaracinaceae bacterium]
NRHFALLREQLIPLPPLAEQREIARILKAVDQRIQAEEANVRALEDLFKTLLHELMSARRRVPVVEGRGSESGIQPTALPGLAQKAVTPTTNP